MKESIDEVISQSVDYLVGNYTLQERIVKPLTKKIVLPYLICTTAFNVIIVVLLAFLVQRLPPRQ
jgi:hypothetical protein